MKIIRVFMLVFAIGMISTFQVFAQADSLHKEHVVITTGKVVDGDTLPHINLEPIVVFPPLTFDNRRQYRRYGKLVRDVKKVYPYAKLAKAKLEQMEKEFQALETERERKAYVKTVEQQLMDEFGYELKKLTISQGRLLLKLIDRETGETSYELLKTLRGSFSAVFWQAVARIFGSSLKAEYDAHGEDYLIERIVLQLEYGTL
jgi:hypothetical protein